MLYVEKVRAWRSEAGDRPTWVSDLVVVERRDGGLEISRHPAFRGQILAPGEWLVLRPAGDFSIISDADFRESYEECKLSTAYSPPSSIEPFKGCLGDMIVTGSDCVIDLSGLAPDLHIADTPLGSIFPDEGGPE